MLQAVLGAKPQLAGEHNRRRKSRAHDFHMVQVPVGPEPFVVVQNDGLGQRAKVQTFNLLWELCDRPNSKNMDLAFGGVNFILHIPKPQDNTPVAKPQKCPFGCAQICWCAFWNAPVRVFPSRRCYQKAR